MKILIVHNDYGKYSGEEAVVDRMAKLYRNHGHTVIFYRMTSKNRRETFWGQVRGFLCGLYSPYGVKGLRVLLEREKPDIVHVHNLYPFISPAALFQCRKLDIPVVMTVHNFRLICPTGLFMRNGLPCEYCLQNKNEWGCIKYNCEHSNIKSVGYAFRNWVARKIGAYKKCVNVYACITEFQKTKLILAGYDPSKILVIPNSIEVPEEYTCKQGTYVAFAGRISSEKGVDLIMSVARRHPEIPFRLAGEVRECNLVDNCPSNVEIVGYLRGDELRNFYRKALFVVIASRCYEGFPMSILEAASEGKTTIAPSHGGFVSIIGNGEDSIGCLFEPGNVDALEQKIKYLWTNPNICERLGRLAFTKVKNLYSTEVVYHQWEILLNDLKNKK